MPGLDPLCVGDTGAGLVCVRDTDGPAGAVPWRGLVLLCVGDTGGLSFADDIVSAFFK